MEETIMDIVTFVALVVAITLAIMGWALAANRKREYRELHRTATNLVVSNYGLELDLINEQSSSAFWQDLATQYLAHLSEVSDMLAARTAHDGWTIFDQTQAETDTDYATLVRSAYGPDHRTPAGLFHIEDMLSDDEEASIKLAQHMLGGTIVEHSVNQLELNKQNDGSMSIDLRGLFDDDCR